jgi:hypothetical protein
MMTRFVLPFLLVACANLFPPTETPQHTPEERLQLAWKGRLPIDVESHPVFSTMEHRVQELSDGSVIVHHLRCASWREPDRVNTFGGTNWATSTVRHGQQGTVCCDRQFVIRGGVVETYRQVPSMGGSCTAEAAFYPDGKRPAGLK